MAGYRAQQNALVRRYQTVMLKLVDQCPSLKDKKLLDEIASLTALYAERFRDYRGAHWKKFRESQLFEVTVRGGEPYTVRTIEAMAKELGWKVSTLRSQLSMKGTINLERENEGVVELISVKRLKLAE
jgi:hypothetical protein